MELNNMQSIEGVYLFKFKVGSTVDFIGGEGYKNAFTKVYDEYEPLKNCTVIKVLATGIHHYFISYKDTAIWVDDESLDYPYKDVFNTVNPVVVNLSMKYFKGVIPFVCMMTNSICFKQNKEITPKGIIWNSTGVNNSNLSEYVQPSNSDIDYKHIINDIGLNDRGNDYNHTLRNDAYHAWIGKNKAGKVISVQTLPWNIRAAGCGTGDNGSADDQWIQINICEDALNNKTYFYAMYEELIHLTAYLCELYEINPFGTVTLPFSDKQYPTIMDHQEAYKAGIATPRLDVFHWFKKYDKNMRKSREEVFNLIANTISPYEDLHTISSVTVDTLEEQNQKVNTIKVAVNVNKLNIRCGPGIDYIILDVAHRDTVFEVIEQNGWGKIVDGEGWIDLQYTKLIEEEPFE